MKGGICMPVTPFLVAGAVVATRMLYTYGGESFRNFFGKIIDSLKNMFSFVSQSTKAGPEYTDRKMKEIEKEEAHETKLNMEKEREQEREEKEKQKEEDIVKRAEASKAKQSTIQSFVPSNWALMDINAREAATNSLAKDIAENMNLSKTYNIQFADMNGSDIPVTAPGNDGSISIILDKNIFLINGNSSSSIDLYNAVVKELAYCRQDEIKEGLVNPTIKEQELQEAASHNISNITEDITIQKAFFLNNRIKPVKNMAGSSYISAPSGTSSYERQAVAILQPAERIPSMMQTIHYEQLKHEIMDAGNVSDEVKECMEKYDKLSYFAARKVMNELYGCRDIEQEIDKALDKNNPMNMDDVKVNNQVMLAVSIYQIQSYAEANGDTFKDPRQDIVESLCGIIPEMSDKQFKWNKGRLAYEGIQVEKVIADEEWKKKYQMDQKDKRKENNKDNHKDGHKNNGQDKGNAKNDKKGNDNKPIKDKEKPDNKPQNEKKNNEKDKNNQEEDNGVKKQPESDNNIKDEPLPDFDEEETDYEPEVEINASLEDVMNIVEGNVFQPDNVEVHTPKEEDVPLESLIFDDFEEDFDEL